MIRCNFENWNEPEHIKCRNIAGNFLKNLGVDINDDEAMENCLDDLVIEHNLPSYHVTWGIVHAVLDGFTYDLKFNGSGDMKQVQIMHDAPMVRE